MPPRPTSGCGGGCSPSGPTRCGTRRSTSGPPPTGTTTSRRSPSPGLLRMSLSDPGSVNLGGRTRRRAERRRSSTPTASTTSPTSSRCAGTIGSGPSIAIYEPGFLRVVLAHLEAGRLPDGCVRQAVPQRRPRPHRRPVRPAADASGARRLPRAARRHRSGVGGLGGRRRPRRRRRVPRPRSTPVAICTSGSSSTAATVRRRTSSWSEAAVKAAADAGRPVATCDEAAVILGLPRRR